MEKVQQRRSDGEGLTEKVRARRSVGEGPSEKSPPLDELLELKTRQNPDSNLLQL